MLPPYIHLHTLNVSFLNISKNANKVKKSVNSCQTISIFKALKAT
ncbi:hypothetical protein EIKCOROL_01493 [Eikenella corrodens ATCC 23834]|uniref:Uncharacterized protein n=1 Tax=Eikenella corrodens ATCC 23834 TaxID=546274 RepID=C0DVV3_EIKCO|nr:hypothetical protein EIKCOROL_01493 [Eikenella corrodens ATCC 23834]